jgi:hypothetical protein
MSARRTREGVDIFRFPLFVLRIISGAYALKKGLVNLNSTKLV